MNVGSVTGMTIACFALLLAAQAAELPRGAVRDSPPRRPDDRPLVLKENTRVDLCVFYSERFFSFGNQNEEYTRTRIEDTVDDMNSVFQNSDLKTRVRLVHTSLVDIDETQFSDSFGLLQAFRNSFDGIIDEVHEIRDANGCDVCMLAAELPSGAGRAYLGEGQSGAFFVVDGQSLSSRRVASHEIGHIFGCNHDPANKDADSYTPYSHGYQNQADKVRDVMSYQYGCEQCDTLLVYSSPKLFEGQVIGNEEVSDCRRVIEERTGEVAGFRPPKQGISPSLAIVTPTPVPLHSNPTHPGGLGVE